MGVLENHYKQHTRHDQQTTWATRLHDVKPWIGLRQTVIGEGHRIVLVVELGSDKKKTKHTTLQQRNAAFATGTLPSHKNFTGSKILDQS